ncbi:MAG: hypothetical protein NC429_04760 [Lachnospiraceae bacterium]|nr:hypothetical protein [Lachnospiraceae bacterium]
MQITIQLDDEARRPIAKIDWFHGCRALIDTGALFPIWSINEDILIEELGAVLIKKNVTFGGFGGEAQGNLYKVNFELNGMRYIDMPIVASKLINAGWHMILSATMFDGMIYEIDTVNKKLNIDTKDNQSVRILRLSDDNNNMSVYLAGTFKTQEEYYNNKNL